MEASHHTGEIYLPGYIRRFGFVRSQTYES